MRRGPGSAPGGRPRHQPRDPTHDGVRRHFAIAGPVLLAGATLLVVEGVASIARWSRPGSSLVHRVFTALWSRRVDVATPAPGLPAATRAEIEALIPQMVATGVGMGNVPYAELVTDRAAINAIGADGCLAPKPGVDKITTYIRSGDFERLDPPSLFYDRTATLPPDLRRFIDRYAVCRARFTSNDAGERTTLPAVDARETILVAGDSVAVGSMIDDAETIPSQLQRSRSDVRFVNLGVNGAAAADIVCRLEKAARRYAGRMAGLIYVYCENDFDPARPYGTPEEVVAWLGGFARDAGIDRVTVVFAPYVYNIVPSITRVPGSRGAVHGTFRDEAGRLQAAVAAAGFDFVDVAAVARAEAERRGTDLAVLALFVDHVHLSGYGVARLVEALAACGR